MNAPDGENEDSSLAARIRTVRDGEPVTALDKAELELALIDRALENRASWAQIGQLLWKCSGPEAKRRVHHLRGEVGRARRLEENRGEEGAQ